MRLQVCIGMLLLACGGCAQLPERVRVEMGGDALELERRCPSVPEPGTADDEEG